MNAHFLLDAHRPPMKGITLKVAGWLCGGICFFSLALFLAQSEPDHILQVFDKVQAMIPVRDGVRLNTEIYIPKNSHELLPFLLLRTPYGISGRPERELSSYLKDLSQEGYIFVFQNIRC